MEAARLKERIVSQHQDVKQCSGKTYSQIADDTGLTNVYVAQLLPSPTSPTTSSLRCSNLPFALTIPTQFRIPPSIGSIFSFDLPFF
ncbi:cyanase [Salvia divinorum]|uniref:Cyanase n=1 Tax=Salvia divinorum TaxID=28513 RepID=A0ABD1FXI9_SALDI